jgi:hypothetical protein
MSWKAARNRLVLALCLVRRLNDLYKSMPETHNLQKLVFWGRVRPTVPKGPMYPIGTGRWTIFDLKKTEVMRQNQGSKRSRGRNQNRRAGPSRNQTFDSNGPSVRIRGNASQVHEKYIAMAQDASSAGDSISSENYLQHAEHYYRILAVQREEAEARANSQPQSPRSNNNNGRPPRTEGPNETADHAADGQNQPIVEADDVDEMPAFVTKKVPKEPEEAGAAAETADGDD